MPITSEEYTLSSAAACDKEYMERHDGRLHLKIDAILRNSPSVQIVTGDKKITLYKGDTVVKTFTDFTYLRAFWREYYAAVAHGCGMVGWLDEQIEDTLGESYQFFHPHDANTAYSHYLGCSPQKFLRVLNAKMFRTFIPKEMEPFIRKYCWGRKGRLNQDNVRQLCTRWPMIQQAIADGQDNLIGLLITIHKSYFRNEQGEYTYTTQQLRKTVGKSIWKKLLKNTASRNNLLGKYTSATRTLQEVVNIPTTIIKRHDYFAIEWPAILSVLKERKLLTKGLDHPTLILIRDSVTMAQRLGRTVPSSSSKWSNERWRVYHTNILADRQQQLRVQALQNTSQEPFAWLKPLAPSIIYKNDAQYTANVLISPKALIEEGITMHHCVGGYSHRVKEQDYMVFSIKKDGKNYSTLGLTFNKQKGTVSFDQHWTFCDKPVEDENAKMLAQQVIDDVNSKRKLLKCKR